MPFEVPTESFNANEHARNKLIRANQLEQVILQQFVAAYEDFWGVSGSDKLTEGDGEQVTTFVGAGCVYTVAQMQSVLNAMPMATAIDVLTDAAQLVGFIDLAYPGVLADRYKTAAFTYTIGQSGITLIALHSAWTPPEE
jgi:hypothetical protein